MRSLGTRAHDAAAVPEGRRPEPGVLYTFGQAGGKQEKRVIMGIVIKRLPGIRPERVGNDLRNQLEGGWNTGDKAKLRKMGGKTLSVRSVATAALAHKGDTTVLRHHQFQYRLFQVWQVILGSEEQWSREPV
jgi:hypothetical protein